ncbi:hypothetical protein CANMA_001769 [Candida margitis]|uniref:uncharacterized protein n=1 Tax=Candida margitis TaxID=1775924 RepID=UPI002227C86B|nr:uncharacterized protein CANMA_001769 [Candida margitis]KAI5969216.1 hypothetical protein CANMA_001769 [Candida margitis]
MFNKIQTYLLQRIFEDLDPSLFQSIDYPLSSNATTISTTLSLTGKNVHATPPSLSLANQGGSQSQVQSGSGTAIIESFVDEKKVKRHKASTGQFKNQINVYNEIIHMINSQQFQLNDDNYQIVVLYFEYYVLYINNSNSRDKEDNPRRQILNYIDHILTSLDTISSNKTIHEINKVLHNFNPTRTLSQLDEIFSDFTYFINQFKFNITKSTLLHALSLTFAYEVFQYPVMANKINNNSKLTNVKQQQQQKQQKQKQEEDCRLLIQFSRFYFISALLNFNKYKSGKFVALDEVVKEFCATEFDKVVGEAKAEVEGGASDGKSRKEGDKEDGNLKSTNGNGKVGNNFDDRLIQLYNAGSLAELRSDEIILSFQEAMKEYKFRRRHLTQV